MKKIIPVFLILTFVSIHAFSGPNIEAQLDEINKKLDSIIQHQNEFDDWFVEVLLADRTLITEYRKAHRFTTEQLYRQWDYPKAYQDLVGRLFRMKTQKDQDLWKRLSPVRKAEFRKFLDEIEK